MKLRLLFYTAILVVFTAKCTEKTTTDEISTETDGLKKKKQQYAPEVSLNDCIHNALYYLDNTEINTYDSIDTHYFHEILDYTDKKAVEMEKKLQILKNSLLLDSSSTLGMPQREQIEEEIDNLRHELYSYEKKVIGYVFIHTYSIKQDTLTAIIVMTKNCSSSQAIPVNAIKDIDPSDYSYKVHQIESNI